MDCQRMFIVLSVFLCQWLITRAEEQNYFFAGSQRFPHSYQQTSNGFINTQDPFRNSPSNFGTFRGNSFVQNTDLDTSDLPTHLQRTLPQYHLSLFDNQRDQSKFHPPTFNSPLQNSNSARFTKQVIPSTHRPSYSHLFSKSSHNHDPSQTETFLGEITIQSPADLPIEFQNRNIAGFQPSIHFPIQPSINKHNNSKPSNDINSGNFLRPPQVVDQNLDFVEKPTPSRNSNQLGGISKPNYLNHRTRIFASESGNRPQVNNYFVNNEGEVFITTKKENYNFQPSTPIPTSRSKQHRFNPTSVIEAPTTEDTRTIENTFNLDSLLEEPLDKSEHSSNKDNVEVIQAVTLSPDKFYFPNPNTTNSNDYASSADDQHTLEDYDYETTEIYDEETTENIDEDTTDTTETNTISKNLANDDNELDEQQESEPKKIDTLDITHNDTNYDVLTMKPSTMVKDDNFKKFVDSSVIDNTTDLPPETNPIPILPVVSVVTTKSIINNTIIGTLPENENVTQQMILTTQPTLLETTNHHLTTNTQFMEQITSPKRATDEETSTEGWVVVASVQTSRSVSGARYLPFPVVEQHERTKFLNEPETEKNENEQTTSANDNESSTMHSREKQNTSTESLIDKLDRVQSDLSSSLLTGSFNNGGNNITVITEGMLDKSDETTMFDSPTNATIENSTTKPSASGIPPVVIRKFSPHARPTTQRSKLAFKLRNQSRKINSPIDTERPQGDQPVKLLIPDIKPKNGTTGRSSGISNQNQIIVQDVNQPKESELSQKTLENILNKIKFKESNAFLPPGYQEKMASKNVTDDVLTNVKTADISAFLPPGYKVPDTESSSKPSFDLSMLLPSDYKPKSTGNKQNSSSNRPSEKNVTNKTDISNLLKKSKQDNISALLPPGYKPLEEEKPINTSDIIGNILKKIKQDNISALLPPGYKSNEEEKSKNKSDVITGILKKTKQDDISAFLPPGYKPPSEEKPKNKSDVLAGILPPGFKTIKSTTTKPQLHVTKQDDIKSFLPPGYKLPIEKSNIDVILEKSSPEDLSKFLPPGYKPTKEENETSINKKLSGLFENAKQDDVSGFLPPGYKPKFSGSKTTTATEAPITTTEKVKETTTASANFKVVFPSRPGGTHRKTQKPSSSKSSNDQNQSVPANSPSPIIKGWPSRATTEFTGWPTPSTTPLSIEKLLERARAAVGATTSTTSATLTTTTVTTTTTTTTTAKPTTPGMCVSECDLAGIIKLVGGAKWVPELLDRNTKEWQILANEVQYQLEDVYSKSDVLSKWYKKIRIDGFSEGSVLVDYLVELNNVSRQINTKDLKGLFHDALEEALMKSAASNREAKSSDLGNPSNENGKIALGNFMVDPTYTDFVVLPKQILPTVGYAEDNVLLPQWAIAIIVIGLASLLFVIIFGVTVIVNKQKNAKKKQPSTLTEEMLNELNKNHMGGIDNYGADDLYNMEDVWNDKPYETKLPKKRSAGSLHDNSMPNIYDSWRSEWNGYYYNTYYGNHPGSSHSGYGRRRSDYDTNF